jgi:HEAT repeat protein
MASCRGGDGPAVAEWVARLGHRDWLERARAAGTLARRGQRDGAVAGALSEALAVGRVTVRCLAAQVLGRLGPRARVALAALAGALRDRNPAVRRAAAVALGRIDPLVAVVAQRRAGRRGAVSLAERAHRPFAPDSARPRRAA